jgi:hypothetical protein
MNYTIRDLRDMLQAYVGNTDSNMIWNKILDNCREMPRRRMTHRKRGGAAYALTGAPLDYMMTPGSAFTTDPSVGVYSRFPIDPTVNPQVVSDLDVFFNSSLSQGCGTENSTLTVPADMGSNQVGGRRRFSMRGGVADLSENTIVKAIVGMGDSAVNHPYLASAYPNVAQSLTNSWQGKVDSIPTSSDPTDHTWKYATDASLKAANVANLASSLGQANTLLTPTGPNLGPSTPNLGPSMAGGARKSRRKHRRSKLHRSRRSKSRRTQRK